MTITLAVLEIAGTPRHLGDRARLPRHLVSESHARQCEAAGPFACYLRVEPSPEGELAAFAGALSANAKRLEGVTHVMLVPEGASLDEGRVQAALATLATAPPDAIVPRAGDTLEADLLGLSGAPDASGRSPRDVHAESVLRAQLEARVAAGESIRGTYEGLEARIAGLNGWLASLPARPLRWWEATPPSGHVVGSIATRASAEIVLGWARVAAHVPETVTALEALQWYRDLSDAANDTTPPPRAAPAWGSIFSLKPEAWSIERTYQAARGGLPVTSEPSILIATPAYGGMHARMVRTLLTTLSDLNKHKIKVDMLLTEGESLVTRARHTLAHLFLMSTCTHLLFWDADLEVLDPTAARRMLAADRAIVGGAYPFRDGSGRVVCNFLENDASDKGPPVAPHPPRTVDLTVDAAGCAAVRHVPTGFMMIARRALVELYEEHPELLYISDDADPALRATPRWDVIGAALYGGHYLSEDWTLCERWRALSSGDDDARHRVYVMVDVDFVHHGVTGSRARLRDQLTRKAGS